MPSINNLRSEQIDEYFYSNSSIENESINVDMINSESDFKQPDTVYLFSEIQGWANGMYGDTNVFTATSSSQFVDFPCEPNTEYKIRDFKFDGTTFTTIMLQVDVDKNRVSYHHSGGHDSEGFIHFSTASNTAFLRIMKRALSSSTYGANCLVKIGVTNIVKKNLEWLSLTDENYGDTPPFYKKNEHFSKVSFNAQVPQRPILTWIDDDTIPMGVVRVKKICDTIGDAISDTTPDTIMGVDSYVPSVSKIKATFASRTDYLTEVYTSNHSNWTWLPTQGYTDFDSSNGMISTLQKYQKEGFHITCHSYTHGSIWNDGDANYNIESCESDLIISLLTLKEYGYLDSDMLVYPFGTATYGTKKLAKKWCKCGVRSNFGNGINTKTQDGAYSLNRIFMKKPSDYWEIDLAGYKTIIDNAYANSAWLILGSHSYSDNEFDEKLFRRILKYALSKGFDVMPLNEAYKENYKYMLGYDTLS